MCQTVFILTWLVQFFLKFVVSIVVCLYFFELLYSSPVFYVYLKIFYSLFQIQLVISPYTIIDAGLFCYWNFSFPFKRGHKWQKFGQNRTHLCHQINPLNRFFFLISKNKTRHQNPLFAIVSRNLNNFNFEHVSNTCRKVRLIIRASNWKIFMMSWILIFKKYGYKIQMKIFVFTSSKQVNK